MRQVVAGVIYRPSDNRFFIQQRTWDNPYFPGMWECAGGKVEKDEDFYTALDREIMEELGVTILNEGKVHEVDGRLPTSIYRVHFYRCLYEGEYFIPTEGQAFAWVTPGESEKHNMFGPDRDAMKIVYALLDTTPTR